MPKASNSGEQGHNFWDLALNGLDDTVTPAIVAFGIMGKDASGVWHYGNVSANGYLMVSGTTGSGGAGSVGDATLVDGTTQTISATLTPVSASPAGTIAGLVTNNQSYDAGKLHVSAIGTLSANQQISAVLLGGTANIGDVSALVTNSLSATADNFRVSAFSPDAGLFHVSAIGLTVTGGISANQQLSAQLLGGTAFIGDVSAIVNNSLSATADNFRVSAFSPDAGLFHVSGFTSTATNFPVSAVQADAGLQHTSAFIDSGSVSAKSSAAATMLVSASQGSADQLRVSALNQDANFMHVSGFSLDAGLFRVSSQNFDYTTSAFMTAIGNSLSISSLGMSNIGAQLSGTWTGTIAFQATIDEANWFPLMGLDNSQNQFISATTVSRNLNFNVGGFRRFRLSATAAMTGTLSAFLDASLGTNDTILSIKQDDAAYARLSSLWSQQLDPTNDKISAMQVDAGNLHVSAIGLFLSANQQISAVLLGGTANIGDVSALSPDAGLFRISAINSISALSPDAGLFHVSGFTSTATNFPVSATQADAGLMHSSAYSGDGNQLHTSAVQGDAGLQHVSASIFPDTTGGLTIFSNFNVSSSQNIKSTAGAVYGWYAWNMDTKPNYINLYNTSGATNVGTDAIQVQIALPASAAANVTFPIGLKGFTAGISVASVSGAVSTSNSPPAASAVGINVFYK